MSSQLQVSGEAKIRDIQGPVVANSGVITALDGAASQYVRGDGTLADFPTSSGGGSSVSYYLNSSVSQGTIGGVAYRELSKEPIIGAGTDISIAANGYVASYITDVNDPDVILIPGGNFNCEFYFSVNNNTGNPFFYAELYKYDGTTFTLLGSSVAVPEYINQGTIIAPYYFAIPVATAALALTDRLAIRIYVNVDGRTVTLHTENGHLCQVVTTLSKGMVSLNNLTDQSQFITTGTSGINFAIVSSGDTHTFNLPIASATNTGKLSSSDWSVFNSKEPAIAAGTTLQYYRGDKTFQTLNTTAVVEATNLYFTDARSRAALSFASGSGAYNSTTGVITIPTNNNQITNGSNFITLASLSGGVGISYNNTTGVITNSAPDQTVSLTNGAGISISGTYPSFTIASTITQYTDALARAAISLTTTGTSGAATYNSTTGVLNVPNYAPDLSGYVPTSRTITINGTSFDLSANRSYSVGTVTSVGLSSATSGVTIGSTPITTSGTITLAIATASGSQNGLLSSTDWTTFNNKQSALTNPITGTGTRAINYIPVFSVTSDSIENSVLQQVNGNIGLGVTPSAWSTTLAKAIQVGNLGSSIWSYTTSNTSTPYTFIDNNAYYDGTNNIYIVNNRGAARYQQVNNEHRWEIAPSGTAGNAISFTQAMTLDANGRLGIGTPSAGYTLDIYKSGGALRIYDISNPSALATYSKDLGAIITSYYSASGSPFTRTMDIVSNADAGAESQMRFLTATSGGNPAVALTLASSGAATFSSSVTASQGIFFNPANSAITTYIGHSNVGAYLGTAVSAPLYFETAGSERMRITSSGNVGIGTTSPVSKLDVNGGKISISNNSGLFIRRADGTNGQALFLDDSNNLNIGYGTADVIRFATYLNTERMRITSGGVLCVNASSSPYNARAFVNTNISAENGILVKTTADSGDYGYLRFVNASNQQIGGIFQASSTTLNYATSSDYRLKQDLKDYNGLKLVSAIKTYDYEWKLDKSRMYGVIAHELKEILPYAVTGEKDGKEMQGVDYSKIVPILVKSIQELKTENDELREILNRNNII